MDDSAGHSPLLLPVVVEEERVFPEMPSLQQDDEFSLAEEEQVSLGLLDPQQGDDDVESLPTFGTMDCAYDVCACDVYMHLVHFWPRCHLISLLGEEALPISHIASFLFPTHPILSFTQKAHSFIVG